MVVQTGVGAAGDRRVLEGFAAHGVQRDRITLVGRRRRNDYFALYQTADICLDTFPYTGCNTTCDALWMGVPVVTLAGQSGPARHCIGILSCLGLPDLVTETTDAYVRAAVDLARDVPRLRGLRVGLRERMRCSPLTDLTGFTRSLEAAYLSMWERHSKKCGRTPAKVPAAQTVHCSPSVQPEPGRGVGNSG
jgi:predicted O-linked N-acetylglucosamine transferase (SPINDLY family)